MGISVYLGLNAQSSNRDAEVELGDLNDSEMKPISTRGFKSAFYDRQASVRHSPSDSEPSDLKNVREDIIRTFVHPFFAATDEERTQRLEDLIEKHGLEGLRILLENLDGRASSQIVDDLAMVVPKFYLDNRIGSACEIIDVLAACPSSPQLLVDEISEHLVSPEEPRKAVVELLQTRTRTNPSWYRSAFSSSANQIGHSNMFDLIRANQNNLIVSETAEATTFKSWLYKDPQQAVEYSQSDSPTAFLKGKAPFLISVFSADNDDFERAREWINLIEDQSDKENALHHLKILSGSKP